MQHAAAECFVMAASLVKEGTFNFTVYSSCWDANKGPNSLSEIMMQTAQIWVLRVCFLTTAAASN